MIQKAEKTWQTSNEYIQIVDMDGRLEILYPGGSLVPYFRRFLFWHSPKMYYCDISMDMINADINLKNYRDSLIKDVEHIDGWCLRFVLVSAFIEDYMCEYLYTYENISKNLAKKVWNNVIYKQSARIKDLVEECMPDVKRYAIKALSDLKSNDDMVAVYEGIKKMLLERYMEKRGRDRLQKAMKRITNEQFKGHKRIAEAEVERQR